MGLERWGQAPSLLPARNRAGWQHPGWHGVNQTLPTGRFPHQGWMNASASLQPFLPGFILPSFLRCKPLLQPWQSLCSLLFCSLLVPLPMFGCSGASWGLQSGWGSSPNPNCFPSVAHPHPSGVYQLPGAAVLSPLGPFSGRGAEAARARGHPGAAPPACGVPTTSRRALLPGLYFPRCVSVCVGWILNYRKKTTNI